MAAALNAFISVDYRTKAGVLRDAHVEVAKGEILGLVGQSGSGKSTFALALLGLLNRTAASVRGSIVVEGMEISHLRERELRRIRGRLMSLIPQNPMAALNPLLRIGTQLREAWLAHAPDWPGEGLRRTRNLLEACGLSAGREFLKRYPEQISIGQAQRVLISMALLHNPKLVIADEPTSALDLITQREVLVLLTNICASNETSILVVSHDLPVLAGLCHRLAVLHEGTIVECGRTAEVLNFPQHPYTRRLISSVPKWDVPVAADENSVLRNEIHADFGESTC